MAGLFGRKFARGALVAVLCVAVAACGGRVAKPVAETRPTDAQLTCAHIQNEAEVNAVRILDLLGEEKASNDNNAAKLMAAPLAIAFPLFLDLSDTEQQEIKALERRNTRLAQLGQVKGCPLTTGT